MNDPGPETARTLDQELQRLEEIVRQLEASDVSLDEALALFEDGVKSLRTARERLAQAELRVAKVLEQASGELRADNLVV